VVIVVRKYSSTSGFLHQHPLWDAHNVRYIAKRTEPFLVKKQSLPDTILLQSEPQNRQKDGWIAQVLFPLYRNL